MKSNCHIRQIAFSVHSIVLPAHHSWSFCFSLYRTASPFLNLTTVLRTEYRCSTTKQSDVWQNVWTFKISLSVIHYLSENRFQEFLFRKDLLHNLQRTNTGHFKKYNLCIYRIYTTVNTFLFFNMLKGGCNILWRPKIYKSMILQSLNNVLYKVFHLSIIIFFGLHLFT